MGAAVLCLTLPPPSPEQLAASIHTSTCPPTWGSTLTTLMTRTKVRNRRKRWEAQEAVSKNSPGKGFSANRLAVGKQTVPVGGA